VRIDNNYIPVVCRHRFHLWVIPLLLCLLAANVLAQESPSAPLPNEENINIDCTDLFPEVRSDEAPSSIFSFLDTPQKTISAGVESVAQSMDEFFANEKVLYDSSGSYIRYSLDTLWQEGGRFTTVGNLDISLRLPRTEHKLKLVLESNPVEKQNAIDRATTDSNVTQETEKSYYAGLQQDFGREDKWRYRPSLGLKLHFPLEYYFRIRAIRDLHFQKWKLRLTESAYWFDTTGFGFDSNMEWDRLIDDDLLFRSESLVRNTEEYKRFDLSQIFSLTQTLTERRAITYSIGFFGNSEPNIHATDYVLQARYRQILHADYLFLDLVPQIRFRIDNAFTEEDSLLMRLEWLFKR
jgi:hypothetical protein